MISTISHASEKSIRATYFSVASVLLVCRACARALAPSPPMLLPDRLKINKEKYKTSTPTTVKRSKLKIKCHRSNQTPKHCVIHQNKLISTISHASPKIQSGHSLQRGQRAVGLQGLCKGLGSVSADVVAIQAENKRKTKYQTAKSTTVKRRKINKNGTGQPSTKNTVPHPPEQVDSNNFPRIPKIQSGHLL